MPIFEYECADCTKTFELLIRGNQVIACPECGGTKLVKKPSLYGFVSSGKFVGSSNSGCDGCHKQSCSGCMN